MKLSWIKGWNIGNEFHQKRVENHFKQNYGITNFNTLNPFI